MNRASTVIVAVLCSAVSFATCACPETPGASTFEREHQVGNFRNEPAERSSDTLQIWTNASGAKEFCLDTIGTNYHQCEVSGSLTQKDGSLIFVDPETKCSLELEMSGKDVSLKVSKDWERFGPCHRAYCGQYTSVESGLFKRTR